METGDLKVYGKRCESKFKIFDKMEDDFIVDILEFDEMKYCLWRSKLLCSSTYIPGYCKEELYNSILVRMLDEYLTLKANIIGKGFTKVWMSYISYYLYFKCSRTYKLIIEEEIGKQNFVINSKRKQENKTNVCFMSEGLDFIPSNEIRSEFEYELILKAYDELAKIFGTDSAAMINRMSNRCNKHIQRNFKEVKQKLLFGVWKKKWGILIDEVKFNS